MTNEASKLAKKQNTQDATSDDLNPAYLFSTTYTDLLVKIATGEVDAQRLARVELAARGLSLHGQWIGFAAAKAEHKV